MGMFLLGTMFSGGSNDSGGCLPGIILLFLLCGGLAVILNFIATAALVILLMICFVALIIGTIAAVINYRRAVITEIYCLKNGFFGMIGDENACGYVIPYSSFRMLSDSQSIKRVFMATYRFQHFMYKRHSPSFNVRVFTCLLYVVIKAFGYAAATVLCLIHGMIFGIILMFRKVRSSRSESVYRINEAESVC